MYEEQMTIYDFIASPSSLDDLPEEEMVRMVSAATGLDFKWDDFFEEYIAEKRKVKFDLSYANYMMEDSSARFISVGYDTKMHMGGGRPCDSVEEAIEYFRNIMERLDNGTKQRSNHLA